MRRPFYRSHSLRQFESETKIAIQNKKITDTKAAKAEELAAIDKELQMEEKWAMKEAAVRLADIKKGTKETVPVKVKSPTITRTVKPSRNGRSRTINKSPNIKPFQKKRAQRRLEIIKDLNSTDKNTRASAVHSAHSYLTEKDLDLLYKFIKENKSEHIFTTSTAPCGCHSHCLHNTYITTWFKVQ